MLNPHTGAWTGGLNVLKAQRILVDPLVVALCNEFGIIPEPLVDPAGFIDATYQVDPRYTGERHLLRHELELDTTKWSETRVKIIMDLAKQMRMYSEDPTVTLETPLEGNFDDGLVIILGGARHANIDRLEYTVQAIRSKQANIPKGRIVFACSTRKLPLMELEAVAEYAPKARTESDLCLAAARSVGMASIDALGTEMVPVCIVQDEKAGNQAVIDLAISQYFAKGVLTPKSRIAVVTTQIYQVAAELDLACVARRKYDITDTLAAGNPSDPAIVAKRTTATYLSEEWRTLRAVAGAFLAGI